MHAMILGESYVLLPTATSPRASASMFSSFRTLDEAMREEDERSARNASQKTRALRNKAFRPTSRHDEQARNDLSRHAEHNSHRAGHMAESVIAVATHADLSLHVQQLTMQNAYCRRARDPLERDQLTPICAQLRCIRLGVSTDRIDRQVLAHFSRSRSEAWSSILTPPAVVMRNEPDMRRNALLASSRQPVLRVPRTQICLKQKSSEFWALTLTNGLHQYEDELKALEDNLSLMDKEREDLWLRQTALEEENAKVALEEDTIWRQLNTLTFDSHVFGELRDSANAHMDNLNRAALSTRTHNMLNDMFVIGQSGQFGTINHFRMGQLASMQVEWNEINAAFGESALLMRTLANMLGFEFADFQVVPLGSFSKIIRISSPRMEYALHGSDSDCFAESLFNLGLGAWLACIGQLLTAVEAQDTVFQFPYKVKRSTINGFSIHFLKNKQTEWTKALKYALTNLKWLQTWMATRWQANNES
ncbi:TPA: LOW QUALITY PROTEIN: hypothetical protein N0F65_010350 [Lagenidium giganteum]|uniref:Atg6 BARA domain-containing protein n=1 Tax=Lagenidium giganteum TaxID=4803 RepID=A0AAV2Z841_9STRA|nr:TPA: LOW QUALITY PROTEIN: hypothetical protein N0F65_010350 [Lagenidium giganteum]